MNLMIPIDNNFYSTLPIGLPEFPLQMFHDNLKNFKQGFVNWHKQKQVEISIVTKGCIELCELGRTITITEGNGFLVFPDYLHAVKPISKNSSEYITLIFDPSLLYGYHDSFFEKEFYTPLSTSGNAFLLLNANQTWVKQIFLEIRWMDEHYPTSSSKTMYRIQQNLQRLWISLSEHSNIYFKDDHLDQNNQKIFSMLNYIQRNYADKFSLSDMADACHVSRGECCRYFKKLMHMKILDYLTEYRIRKAIELLENTELSITEIAHGTGFGTASYFITIFKSKIGCSPLIYRKTS